MEEKLQAIIDSIKALFESPEMKELPGTRARSVQHHLQSAVVDMKCAVTCSSMDTDIVPEEEDELFYWLSEKS